MERVTLATLMVVATVNVYTGSPLLALWIGSQIQGAATRLSMAAVGVTVGCLALFTIGLLRLIAMLDRRDDALSGRTARHRPSWLQSSRGNRPHGGEGVKLSALERILVISVVLAVAAFEVWFFFFSGSSIDQRSGR